MGIIAYYIFSIIGIMGYLNGTFTISEMLLMFIVAWLARIYYKFRKEIRWQ